MSDTMAGSRIELKIPGRPEFVRVARLAVAAVATQMGFPYDGIEDLKTATSEALTNAIRHAHASGSAQAQEIMVVCCLESDALVVEVHDSGTGFDPERRRAELERDELQEGGLGLLIMDAFMDRVQFESRPGGGTVVRMTKRLPRG